MSSPGTLSFATSQGMVYGVHGDPPNPGIPSQPPGAARFAQGNILMIQIADLSYRSITIQMNQPDLPGRKLDMGILSLFGHELSGRSGAADDLRALAPF